MKITALEIEGLLLIEPNRIEDARGYFSETFRLDRFQEAAGPITFVQDNQSFSARRGTIRGLVAGIPPAPQGKLIRVTRGAIIDVAVDIRAGSPSYGKHVALELSAENGHQLWIPEGFLHGFCTLTDACHVLYKVTSYYSRDHDAGVRWNDPRLAIAWPIAEAEAQLSDKDRNAPLLEAAGNAFTYSGLQPH